MTEVYMTGKISVVINTLNEERNLPYALRSVRPWADEIIVMDMYSEDRTVEVARAHGAKVFFHERVGFVEPARACAIAKATTEWILILDADELVPAPLSHLLRETADDDRADVVVIPNLNYFLGGPLMHTGWGPEQNKHARFFKRGMLQEATAKIHDYLEPVAEARMLELAYTPGHAIVHFNYVDTSHFLEKLNRYTTIEARQALERGERSSVRLALYKAAKEFYGRFFKRQGYRDGWRGLYLSGLQAMYNWATYTKLRELEATGGREAILELYGRERERLIADYTRNTKSAEARS
jgi:glycosyltransferase involved in cell wall biosynthesis